MFENAFNNIDRAMRNDEGLASELDYAEQASWLLFLKYLDDFEAVQEDDLVGLDAALPVVRGRVAPNILFFALAPEHLRDGVERALRSFVERCHKAELIEENPA